MRLRDPLALPLTCQEPHLDLNYLFHRRGISLMMADRAACDQSRLAHRTLAGAYARRIAEALGKRRAAA